MIVALTIGAVAGVTRHQAADAAEGPVPGIGIQRLGSSYANAAGYDRYAYVITGRADAAAAATQPGTSLVYHSGVSVNTVWDSGVPYSVASANGWLLTSSSGELLRNVNYPDNYIGDVGNSAYQAEWARRVGDYLASVGADGVYIDDVIADVTTMTGGIAPGRYPSQAAWEDAMVSFVTAIGATLRARGFYVLLNAHKYIAGNGGSDDGSLEAQWWRRLAPSVSGLMNEHFVQNAANPAQFRATGSEWYNQWAGWQGLVAVAQNAGVDFFGLTYAMPADTRWLRYAKGSFLLDWDGGGGALIVNPSPDASSPGDSDPWSSEWAVDIGRPSGAKYQVGVGWRRNFSEGTVVVNPSSGTFQTFPLGAAYAMPDGSTVTTVTLSPMSALILRSTGTTPPVNTALPLVRGTPQQGSTLSASTGSWSGGPTAYAYQWRRCDAVGGACASITGATSASYMLGMTDVGRTVRVMVTASNTAGPATATSAATAVISSTSVAVPVNTALPAIAGNTQQGSTLTASTGSWTNSPTAYAYQWQRCGPLGGSCGSIGGATSSSYSLGTSDVGHTIRVLVTASNTGGAATATSAAAGTVASAPSAVAPANTALPAVDGNAQQGSTLTASTGSWTNSPTAYAYQWQRCNTAGSGCSNLDATAAQYTLTSDDVGRTVRVGVRASNTGGSSAAESAASPVVAPAAVAPPTVQTEPPASRRPPNVTGPEHVGRTVTAGEGSWDGHPTSYAYQWLRCAEDSLASCVPITGATDARYMLTAEDLDRFVIVSVTASNAGGSSSAASRAGGRIRP